MKKETNPKAVLLPARLYNQIEQRVKVTGFDSVDTYVKFVLEEVVKVEEEVAPSKEDEEELKRRLRALGYQD